MEAQSGGRCVCLCLSFTESVCLSVVASGVLLCVVVNFVVVWDVARGVSVFVCWGCGVSVEGVCVCARR